MNKEAEEEQYRDLLLLMELLTNLLSKVRQFYSKDLSLTIKSNGLDRNSFIDDEDANKDNDNDNDDNSLGLH